MKVLISYDIIFEPSETWTSMSQFDADFATFLASRGLEAENVRFTTTQPNQLPPKRVIIIRKKEQASLPENPPEIKSIKAIKADLTRKQGFDGKFKK